MRLHGILIFFLLIPTTLFAATLKGIPRILDGDTVEIGSVRIRLQGIDAPESDQLCLSKDGRPWSCGISSRDALLEQFGKSEWLCLTTGSDRYRRLLANCAVNGQDVQQWLVRNGWALSFVRYSRAYDAEQVEARTQHLGLWAGAFIAPWDWRRRTEKTEILGATTIPINAQSVLLPGSASPPGPSGCDIKGNMGRAGQCIYHLPTGRWYQKVNMSSRGKRWFCSVAEAEAAGCRAAKE